MSTYAETIVEERLRPEPVTVKQSNLVAKRAVPYSLMRTSSLDRIRQFPTYFCRQRSSEIIQWLSSSKSKFSKALSDLSQQFHLVLLTLSVYAAVGFLVLQLVTCLITVFVSELPLGLIFLLLCVILMAVLAVKLMPYTTPTVHRSRSPAKRPKTD